MTRFSAMERAGLRNLVARRAVFDLGIANPLARLEEHAEALDMLAHVVERFDPNESMRVFGPRGRVLIQLDPVS